jgi:hypothetical protein
MKVLSSTVGKNISFPNLGELLWLRGKVVKNEKINEN